METPYLPRHTLENAVAAAAACYAAGLPVAECAAGIPDCGSAKGGARSSRLAGLCLIDDTYNANPAAVRAALDNLVGWRQSAEGGPVAVLGDMLELGPDEERFHEQTGAYAAEAGVSALWGVGPLSAATVRAFGAGGSENGRTAREWSAGHVALLRRRHAVVAGLRPGDVVLFKASRALGSRKW